jgi:hypothetical protein
MDPLTHPVLRQRGPLTIQITDATKCFYCQTGPLNSEVKYCPSCGFPQNGPEEEQKRFVTHKRILLGNLDQVGTSMKKARNGLFGAAALYGLSYILGAVQSRGDSAIILIEGAIVVATFLGLAIYASRNAYAAALAGLIVFVTLMVAYAIVNPITIISGILWKVIILSSLIYGLKAARDYKRLHAELKENKIDFSAN